MDQLKILAEIDHALTEVDLILWTWQTDLDMMSFIGQDIPIRVYEAEPKDVDMTFKRVPTLNIKTDGEWVEIPPPAEPEKIITRVPLVKYEDGKRVVIGIADVDEANGVMKAEVFEDHAEILAIPGGHSFSIMDEDPPVFDHTEIKRQLRNIISPSLYRNQYAHSAGDIIDNHPFFKE